MLQSLVHGWLVVLVCIVGNSDLPFDTAFSGQRLETMDAHLLECLGLDNRDVCFIIASPPYGNACWCNEFRGHSSTRFWKFLMRGFVQFRNFDNYLILILFIQCNIIHFNFLLAKLKKQLKLLSRNRCQVQKFQFPLVCLTFNAFSNPFGNTSSCFFCFFAKRYSSTRSFRAPFLTAKSSFSTNS